MMQRTPVASVTVDVLPFIRMLLFVLNELIKLVKVFFPTLLDSTWRAGVVSYEVDFDKRKVTYWGCEGEFYTKDYPVVSVV
jgi:uncharacterized protein YbcV (DUF1398 family)